MIIITFFDPKLIKIKKNAPIEYIEKGDLIEDSLFDVLTLELVNSKVTPGQAGS